MKIPTRRVPSDDCVVYVGRRIVGSKIVEQGKPYAIHEGEWVEVVSLDSVGLFLTYMDLQRYQEEMRRLADLEEASAEEISEASQHMNQCFTQIIDEVSSRVSDWNWTDLVGKPLPKPYDNRDVLRKLSTDELLWLVSAIEGETGAERKNGSEPSPTTSLAEGHLLEKPI